MKIFCQKFRIQSEPYRMIASILEIQFEENHEQPFSSVQIQPYGHEILKNTLQVNNYFQPLLYNKFNNLFVNLNDETVETIQHKQIDQLIIEVYEYVLENIDKKRSQQGQHLAQCTQIAQLIQKNQSRKLTIAQLIFYEVLLYLAQKKIIFQDQHVKKFLNSIELNPKLQPYLFSSTQMLREFSQDTHNPYVKYFQIAKSHLKDFVHFAFLKNLIFLQNNSNQHIPFSAIPFKGKKESFDDLFDQRPQWIKICSRMSRDSQFISNVFEEVAKVDIFVDKLLKLHLKSKQYEFTQKIECAIIRNDYLFDSRDELWKQVEINLISCAFGPQGDNVQKLQNLIWNGYQKDLEPDYQHLNLQKNLDMMCDTFVKAYNLYNNPKAKMLMLICSNENNVYDQYLIVEKLLQNGIYCLRLTLDDLRSKISRNHLNGKLYINDDEIFLVYFRSCYTCEQHNDDWNIREIIECSQAIKCPSVQTQLINFKKVQQVIQNDSILRQYLDDDQELQLIKKNFAKIWSLDNFECEESRQEILDMITQDKDNYVLKPQKEGGMNNFYSQEMVDMFKSSSIQQLKQYILMQKIKTIPRFGLLVKQSQIIVCGTVSEVGIFSSYISDEKDIIYQQSGGYLIRTKSYDDNEGGVVCGFSVLDSAIVL